MTRNAKELMTKESMIKNAKELEVSEVTTKKAKEHTTKKPMTIILKKAKKITRIL